MFVKVEDGFMLAVYYCLLNDWIEVVDGFLPDNSFLRARLSSSIAVEMVVPF